MDLQLGGILAGERVRRRHPGDEPGVDDAAIEGEGTEGEASRFRKQTGETFQNSVRVRTGKPDDGDAGGQGAGGQGDDGVGVGHGEIRSSGLRSRMRVGPLAQRGPLRWVPVSSPGMTTDRYAKGVGADRGVLGRPLASRCRVPPSPVNGRRSPTANFRTETLMRPLTRSRYSSNRRSRNSSWSGGSCP